MQRRSGDGAGDAEWEGAVLRAELEQQLYRSRRAEQALAESTPSCCSQYTALGGQDADGEESAHGSVGRLTQRLLGPASLGRAAAALERCCAHEAAFWATVLMESATSLDLSMEAGAHTPHMHARSSSAMSLTLWPK